MSLPTGSVTFLFTDLALQKDVNDRRHTPALLEGLAALLAIRSDPAGAVRLLAAAAALRQALPLARMEVERPAYEQTLAALHRQLDDEAFRAAWSESWQL